MILLHLCRLSKSKWLLFFSCLLFINTIFYLFIKSSPSIIEKTAAKNATNNTQKTKVSHVAGFKPDPLAGGGCHPYTVPDSRPFFEREYPQQNLPRRASYSNDEDLFRYLRSLRVHVLAAARNIEKNIDNFRNRMESIVDLFHPSSRILICESYSTDKTVEKLKQWSRAQVYAYGDTLKAPASRTERIAFCRNKLLNVSQEITADYLLVIDSDMTGTNTSAVIANFRYNTDDWSVMTAVTIGTYYDIWALRTLSESIINYDVWRQIPIIAYSGKGYCYQSVLEKLISDHQKKIPIDYGLIEVRSAFNGAGLYKANATYGCQYSGETCEHVSFNLCIRDKNKGRIFINPAFFMT